MSQFRILRKDEATNTTALSKSNLNVLTKAGLFPPLISLGGSRAVGYIEHEVVAVMTARAAGYDNDKIHALVTSLVEQRKDRLNELLLDLCA